MKKSVPIKSTYKRIWRWVTRDSDGIAIWSETKPPIYCNYDKLWRGGQCAGMFPETFKKAFGFLPRAKSIFKMQFRAKIVKKLTGPSTPGERWIIRERGLVTVFGGLDKPEFITEINSLACTDEDVYICDLEFKKLFGFMPNEKELIKVKFTGRAVK